MRFPIVNQQKKSVFVFFPHLPLNIVNSPTGSVTVGAVVLVVNLLNGVIHLIFHLEQLQLLLLLLSLRHQIKPLIHHDKDVTLRNESVPW